MKTTATYKPVGGVESATLYPADAVGEALFSSRGCEVELSGETICVPLLDDGSRYEERAECKRGIHKVSHTLHLVADRDSASEWFAADFLERASTDGVIAIVTLCDGRRLLLGYSAHFGDEQPLRLESLISNSGETLRDIPTATLCLVSHDTEFSPELLNYQSLNE